ncbi:MULTISPECIES: type II restriction endonuclease [Anaeromyxobacter]|uniref:type II restriction endonuclease n=1 Tax=Anaeromyxobacter TaxID=161492 RepID=UPI001F578096|nr:MULTISPECIES: type II restriction endonuclease [unclassified Anaeromyxobacter]
MTTSPLRDLVARWRDDPGGTYRTWFTWDERLKNFRSIRRGIEKVVAEIEAGAFGNVYKGSSLETAVGAIAEQRQIFKGADHAFLWKPKLRIPDIYEDRENQLAFGRFLGACLCCGGEEALLAEVRRLAARRIKGLGPAAANLLYFLHPTLALPFNTAIVNGYNALAGAKVKLGRWDDYLALREGALRLVAEHRDLLSNDLGAVAGLLFDVGSGRYRAPPRADDAAALTAWQADLAKVREESAKERKTREAASAGDRTHTEIQAWLRDLGRALGYGVWIASNDRNRPWGDGRLCDGCLAELPPSLAGGAGSGFIPLIDVLWLEPGSGRVEAAFEVEHTTTIQTGVMRMLDLAETQAGGLRGIFLVAPDDREDDVRRQLSRPAFRRIGELDVRWLPYGELARNREAMARFGTGLKAVARRLG